MNEEHLDPELVKRAKEQAAGPLGRELAKFPLRFAAAGFFGKRPVRDRPVEVNHGTMTLVELGGRRMAVTCSHVLKKYREISDDSSTLFQISGRELDPLERIIGESPDLDLVSIDLSDIDVDELVRGEEIGSCFFVPRDWPPKQLQSGDFVAFGGFPGKWRRYPSWDEIVFDSWSSGACGVASVREEYFVCQFEREYWVESFNIGGHEGMELDDIGGLSGGPVFILRGLRFELVGVIYEFSSEFDLMYVRPTQLIREDGTFCPPSPEAWKRDDVQ